MARSQEDWNELIRKHGYGINTTKATKDELEEYVVTKMHVHTADDFSDFSLWTTFMEEFEDFTIDDFQQLRPDTRSRLRKHLLKRGVYINTYNKRYTIAHALFDLLQEEEPHKWTDEEINLALEEISPMITITLRNRLSSTKDALITPLTTSITTTTPAPTTPILTDLPEPASHSEEPRIKSTYTKEIATVAKIYTDEQKYDGVNDSFDFKLTIFYDICKRSGLPEEGYMTAFPTMLKGLAQDHYYNSNLSARTFTDTCYHIRQFFEGQEYHRKNLTEWNAITLQELINKNPDKSIYQNFQLLIGRLLKLRHGIHVEFRTDLFFTNKLVTACQGIPACRIAISNPTEGISQLINSLQSSIVAWEKENQHATTQETYYTDRKYHRHEYNRSSISNYDHSNHYDNRRNSSNNYQRRPERGKCYICQKENCRSWKHTEDERKRSREEYKRRFNNNNKDKDRKDNFGKRFRQYITYCEGDDNSDYIEAFEALILDTDEDSDDGDDPDCFFTTLGILTPDEARSMSSELANRACTHLLNPQPTDPTQEVNPFNYNTTTLQSRYASTSFIGIMIDTGASKVSTAGYGQFQALQKTDLNTQLNTSTKGQINVQFGIGTTPSIGTVDITSPIGRVQFHVVYADTPFLLCLADMDRLQIYYNNLTNTIITPTKEVPIVRRFGHPFLLWNSSLQSYLSTSFSMDTCYLTDVELRRLHRRFGHPSVERLQRLLYNTNHDVDEEAIKRLTKFCYYCQRFGKSPGRFRFTLREQDDVSFNYNIIVDVMYISNMPLLHIVDEATRFQAGRWLQDISAKHTWDTLRMCWIDMYLGPPDLITHDAGKNFVSKEFKQYAATMGIQTKGVPVEAHNSIGIVERYHGPIRRAYQIIKVELPGLSQDMALQMAFKAINDTAGPGGLVPTLLVFGAYPRLIESDPPSPTVIQRAAAIKKAMGAIQKLRAERQVADALNMRNGPKTDVVHDLPPNSQVLVWREGNGGQTGHWEGPLKLLTVEGETCTIQYPRGPTPFRTTVVKPYHRDESQDDDPETGLKETLIEVPTPPPVVSKLTDVNLPLKEQLIKRGRGRPRKYPLLTAMSNINIFIQNDNPFTISRKKELNGLLEKGVFEITAIKDVPPGVRLFNSRFVDEVKHPGTEKAFEKSRLVVQAYNDPEKELVLTQSPTIQRVSQRLILCIAAMKLPNVQLYLRDISQAYVQSTTNLNREFYIRPPQELNEELGIDVTRTVLRVVKPLYGVPEAGNHWFKTYHSHHLTQLSMDQSTYDPCLLYCNSTQFGITGLQTDDTLLLADDEFARKEQEELQKAQFTAKEREQLTTNTPIKFNGGIIELVNNDITLTQQKQCNNLTTISIKPSTSISSRGITRGPLTLKDQYIAQRARGAYIASVCQPEASFDLSFAAQVINPTENDTKELNKRLEWQIKNPQRGLKFVKLDIESLQLLVFTDASFANNKDLSSQIGYVIVLTDSTKKANIIHWSSIKCKRVTRSVLASELYGMTYGNDISMAIKSTIDKILKINLPLVLCTDSKSLYDCLVRLGTTQEKRLMIDVMCLRQAYERRQITEVKWIDGNTNPADAMTKSKPCGALQQLIDTNYINLQAIGWVERTKNKDTEENKGTEEYNV